MDYLEKFLTDEVKNLYHLLIRADCSLEIIDICIDELQLNEFSESIPAHLKNIKFKLNLKNKSLFASFITSIPV